MTRFSVTFQVFPKGTSKFTVSDLCIEANSPSALLHAVVANRNAYAKVAAKGENRVVFVKRIEGLEGLPRIPKRLRQHSIDADTAMPGFTDLMSLWCSNLMSAPPGSEVPLDLLRMTDTWPIACAVMAGMADQPTEPRATTAARLDDRFILRALTSLYALDMRKLAEAFAPEGVTYADLCARAFMRPSDEIPTELPDGPERTRLDALIRRLSGDGERHERGWARDGVHQGDCGTCGNFAEVVDQVLEAGGHYMVMAGLEWIPERVGTTKHVAVRVGDFIIDACGVQDWGEFAVRWGCGPDEIHEPVLTTDSGLMEGFRIQLARRPNLDVEAFRHDLQEATGGPLPRRGATNAPRWR